VGGSEGFRWRGEDVWRVEGFSDAVFAFAVTLLVVSLEVPETFDELIQTMRGFLAFAISFALLIWIWYEHYKFFRRYGLRGMPTLWINAVLLFLVLFFVYPLKVPLHPLRGPTAGRRRHGDDRSLPGPAAHDDLRRGLYRGATCLRGVLRAGLLHAGSPGPGRARVVADAL
jgi:hypothetical protein